MHVMDSCRIEKAYRHFGHDITCEDHILEAGLGFAVNIEKASFIGKEAVIRKKENGLESDHRKASRKAARRKGEQKSVARERRKNVREKVSDNVDLMFM